ncbi:MAG: hypothetical protein GX442_25595, partial [Candidatus Riflebacteria bacterium]|nr:hypothetical protein [Candidatus Riflebacteria bacterium]
SNLGYDQVDVPIYMAIESAEPKLYLVTTPRLVKGARQAPAPYTPIPQSQWLSHSGVVPGYTLHPSAEAFGRGYIRECIKPYVFENGKPKAGPVKYIFSKMFDINCDGNIDSVDRAFLERGLKIADFNEDGNVDTGDCASIWNHSFGNFPRAFEALAAEIRLAFARDPRLLAANSTVYATAGPVAIEEVSYNVNGQVTGRVAHIQIGWWGNAFTGQFTVTPVPGSPSAKFPFAPTGISYTTRTDPGVTGANFLPNLGPMPFPSRVEDASRFPELYRSDTAERADGTLLGRLKRAAVIAYRKCDMSGKNCYPVGDPWGIGLLESIESGVMGQLPLYGDVDGVDGFNQADLAKWEEVKQMEGFILSSVWQHPIGVAIGKPVVTDLNREFRVIAGGKFSAYPPAGADSFVLKESYNYRFLDPVIWAYDAREGNQMSFGRRFRLDGGGGDPGGDPPPPPYPPTQTKRLPTQIVGPNDIPEDIPQTWTAPGVEEVVIKPDTWEQKWSVSPGGAAGSGVSFTSEFKLAGRYTITHTVKYTQRIVTPVTDSLGIIVYYAVTDIPQTRTLTLDIVVFDHEISEFEDPKFELKGPGNSATYARQWGADAAGLRTRDFPSAFKAYPETMAIDTRPAGVPSMHDNNWLTATTRENGKEYRDHHFDLVNADPSKSYDFETMLEMRFARKVTETSDLNLANVANADHLEAYSGVLLSAPITLKLEINQLLPDGGVRSWKTFTFTPDVSAKGEVEVDPANMGEYLVKVGDRYMKVQTAKFPAKFAWDLPVPTFPNEGYETVVTLTCTQRGYYLDHPSQTDKLKTRFGSAFSRLTLNGEGVIRYLDRDFSYTWRRKSLTVDVTPPTLTAFEEHDGLGTMVPVAGGVIHGTTGDQTRFRFATSDNHPAYGPNDGLKDGGTRRVWYPRFWLQAIDGRRGRFTPLATEGYELPLIVPTLRDKLNTSPDGNLAADLTAFTKERVDGHHLSVVAPTDLETIGTRAMREMTIQQQFSNYIAGKIRFVLEVEDGSRNFVRQEGWFQVVDNKRPNLDLRLATAKYKPLPDDGSLTAIPDILTQVPLGPAASPHGLLGWAGVSPDAAMLADRTRAAKDGLLVAWRHPYNDPDLVFAAGGAFTSRFTAPGHVYQREANLDEVRDNLPITETNTSKWDDQVIRLGDRDIKAAFQVANPGDPGFAEDEVVVLDLSVRDNLLFWQDDSLAPNGRVVADHAFRKIGYEFLQNVIDERKVAYRDELAVEVVRNPDDPAPLRLLNPDGTPLSYIFRVGNADAATGLRNPGTGASTGSNTFRLETLDLNNNRRDLEIDFPIVPSRFQIRILETDIQADRKK